MKHFRGSRPEKLSSRFSVPHRRRPTRDCPSSIALPNINHRTPASSLGHLPRLPLIVPTRTPSGKVSSTDAEAATSPRRKRPNNTRAGSQPSTYYSCTHRRPQSSQLFASPITHGAHLDLHVCVDFDATSTPRYVLTFCASIATSVCLMDIYRGEKRECFARA